MKPKLTIDQMIEHMKSKNIKFEIVSEEDAKEFLRNNNYYMKLMAYRNNYKEHSSGDKQDKYNNLEFAYLRDLSTIDMHLRRLIIKMCLDIEHYIKLRILNDVENNPKEDGYEIVREFIYENETSKKNFKILDSIKKRKSSPYSKDLITKYYPYFPVWVFLELVTFGELTYFCDFYAEKNNFRVVENKFMNIVRDIRNAAAHNNCIMNRMFDTKRDDDTKFQVDVNISSYIKKISTIGSNSKKHLNYSVIYDLVVLIYAYSKIVTSEKMKQNRYGELKDLFVNRIGRNIGFYEKNSKISSWFDFMKKVVDNL